MCVFLLTGWPNINTTPLIQNTDPFWTLFPFFFLNTQLRMACGATLKKIKSTHAKPNKTSLFEFMQIHFPKCLFCVTGLILFSLKKKKSQVKLDKNKNMAA